MGDRDRRPRRRRAGRTIFVTNFAGEPKTLYRNVEGALFDDATEASGVERAVAPVRAVGDRHRRPRRRRAARPRHGLGAPHPEAHHVDGEALRKQQEPRPVRARRPQLQAAARSLPERGRRPAGGRDGAVGRPRAACGSRRAASRRATWTATGASTSRSPPISGGIRLLRNATAAPGHALEILPVAGADRRTVLGTKVVVTAGGLRQVQEFILRPSYASGAWVPLHFGLGKRADGEGRGRRPGRRRPPPASRASRRTASTRCATGSSRRRGSF